MLGLLRSPWAILALLATLAGGAGYIGVRSYNTGYAKSEAEHAAALEKARAEQARAAEAASRKEEERLALEREIDVLQRELEDAARSDPGADRPALGADSVSRLNRL
mgnify:CR=1 FL=1